MPEIELLHEAREVDGAARTFDVVLEEIERARESIEIHMYVWRSDEIGNRVGEALLAAADRGVAVRIVKDTGAFLFERIEMNRKSFFNVPVGWLKEVSFRVLRPTFPDTFVEDGHGHECGERLMSHPGVEIRWVNETHTKYYVFDDRVIVTGSINLEDRHRGYHDYMVRIEGKEEVARMRRRMTGEDSFDPGRELDFLCNGHRNGESTFEIKEEILRRIRGVKKSLFVEMAYLGDEEVSEAIVEVARRGARVVILFSREANIGNDLNYRTIHEIYRRSTVQVYLTSTMIHSSPRSWASIRRTESHFSAGSAVRSSQRLSAPVTLWRSAASASTPIRLTCSLGSALRW